MRYTTNVLIDLPRERVIELFDSSENLKEWQLGLQSFEPLSGEPGTPGAKTKLVYDMGGRSTEMVETIVEESFPEEFIATYEASGVWNWNANRFYEEGPGLTRWELETDFKFSGMMKILSFFMRSSFPKQTRETMESFKRFAERSSQE